MGYRGIEDFFHGLTMLGQSLQQVRNQREDEELRRLKNYYGENIEAFRQDALKDAKLEKQYRKFVGDPNLSLPEDPKMAQQRQQIENLRRAMGPEYDRAIAAVSAGVPWETAIKQFGPQPKKEFTTKELIDIAKTPSEVAVNPPAESVTAFKNWAMSGGQAQALPDLTNAVSSFLSAMQGNPLGMAQGSYQTENAPAYTADIGNITSAWGKTKKEAELEESARKEAESLRRFEIGQVNYKERTDAINRRLNDASARAWRGLTNSEQKYAVNGLKTEMDRRRGPINQAIETAQGEKRRAEDALNKIRTNNESRMRRKDWATQPANAELSRIVQGLVERIQKADEIISGKNKELKQLENWYNGQIQEVDPNYKVYTTEDEEDSPSGMFMDNS